MPRRSEKAATWAHKRIQLQFHKRIQIKFFQFNFTLYCELEWDSGLLRMGQRGMSLALFWLTYLSTLGLSRNDFTTSQIPNQFHRLPNMAYLRLAGSGVMGSFSSTLVNLKELVELDISSNILNAPIPSFHKCKNLSDNNLIAHFLPCIFMVLKTFIFGFKPKFVKRHHSSQSFCSILNSNSASIQQPIQWINQRNIHCWSL